MKILPVVAVLSLIAAAAPPAQADPTRDMVFVQGDTFEMGTHAADIPKIQHATGVNHREPFLAELPAHEVSVDDFYIDVHDVTNRDFSVFVTAVPIWNKKQAGNSPHNGRYLEHWFNGKPPRDALDHPVTFVTWYAAVAYCDWRGKRLPSESEYEWAAQDPDTGAEYPWGSAPPNDELVSWGSNGIDGTVPVGRYPANRRGLYDMSGNVWHFTSDPWLGSYGVMLANPEAVDEATIDPRIRRVVRGGSWGANAANLRVRYRDSHRPFDAREMVGFRCAKSAE